MKKKKYYNILFLGDIVRKKDLFEQNTLLYNRLQTALDELDKYKKLYKENIEEINSLRRQLVEMEKQQIEAAPPVLTEQAPPVISAIFDTEEPKVQTDIEVELPDIIQYGAQIIGKIVLEGTKASNSFRDNPSEYSKDLINLVLGKTEVCKSAIYDICHTDAEDAEKIKNIDDVYKDAADYFQSLYKQV